VATEDYRKESRKAWEAVSAGWERKRNWMWGVTGAVGRWLVDALDPQPGETILELAAGLGDTGFAVAERLGDDGRLITSDFSPGMLDAARRNAAERGLANVEVRTLDAERMELEDASVDGVVCRWGYMLMADPGAALRETRRVLRDGGRVAFSVWAAPERNPWATVAGRAVFEYKGEPPPDPDAPGVFALARKQRIRELLREARLDPHRIEELEVGWRFESVDDYWQYVGATSPLSLVIRELPEEGQEAVREGMARGLEPFARGDGTYDLRGVCLNVLAR
jgi:ubiquinone/menaquinone biosynthesis C-methylase UbiE